jgi:hypothetical protein
MSLQSPPKAFVVKINVTDHHKPGKLPKPW